MIVKTIACELCKNTIKDDSKGVGLYFLGNRNAELRPLLKTETHFCNDCALACLAAFRTFVASADEAETNG